MSYAETPTLYNSSGQKQTIVKDIQELCRHYNLIANLVQRDLTVRYKRSVLGFFWTMLNPLALMIIFTIVFANIFRFEDVDHYEIYFLSEYLVFMFFSQTTCASMTSLSWHGTLMKKMRVPKSIFAVATVVSGLINLCLAYVPLFAIMLFRGASITPAVLFLPVSFLIIAMFSLGVSLFLSALAVFFEDVSHMYQVATTALMYLTPIIYPIYIVPTKFLWLIRINPLTQLFKLARDPIYNGVLPSGHVLLASIIVSIVSLVVGWSVFNRLSRNFYLYL